MQLHLGKLISMYNMRVFNSNLVVQLTNYSSEDSVNFMIEYFHSLSPSQRLAVISYLSAKV